MKKIRKIRSGFLSRGSFAAKTAFKALPSLLSQKNPDLIFKALIGKNVDQFVDDVGALKGSVLKAAQILSAYGEYYLPQEVNKILKAVQSQSHYLPWSSIEKLIPKKLYQELEIQQTPLAAASIGQLHLAQKKSTDQKIALKIQYPGVKKAIDLDIKILKSFLSLTQILPKKIDMSMIYQEIKRVLSEEMDYPKEARKQEDYKKMLKDLPNFYVPEIYPEYSSENIIASEYIKAQSLAEIDLNSLEQESKNKIGAQLFYLYFYELFKSNLIQTDCHGGNFLLQRENNQSKLILIDFGACLYFDQLTIQHYRKLIRYLFQNKRQAFFDELKSIARENDSPFHFNEEKLWQYARLAQSPLESEDFDWGSTNLPDQLYPLAKDLISETHLERPPHQFIFLDRKILGIFSLLKALRARFNVKEITDEFISEEA